MIKKRLILIVTIIFTIALFSFAKTATRIPPHSYYLNGSYAFPANPADFNTMWDSGPGFGLGIGHAFNRKFILIGHFNYNRFEYRGETSRYEDGDLTMMSVSTCLKVRYAEIGGIYTTSGLGYFKLTSDGGLDTQPWAPRATSGVSETNFALFFGPGIEFKLSEITSLFIEAQYVICLSGVVSTHYIPIKLGLSFDLPGRNMGQVK